MRLRTVAKLGVVLSVVLFCIAVGFYGFTRLSICLLYTSPSPRDTR